MIYTIEQIKEKIAPIARRYHIPAIYVFGSYARGQATDASDLDIIIDRTGSTIRSLIDMGSLYCDLNESFNMEVDLITVDALDQPEVERRTPGFKELLREERVIIYEQ
ncbi:MAG: nucleotidyltransferase domain-containing protein [Treponema sp.]|nr:nucleotidyltransferase domain-containing protein [Treponema sp.]